jgi:tRNA-uridine 2-sulfurtransferase
MNTKKGKKVLVALSGGVDSSVAAALLQQEGYEVEGAFIITWQAPWLPCTWPEERRDAMRVSAHLGIRFHTIDLSKEYERDVVEYLVREYRAGRTPNPDVMCNKYVKLGAFFDQALAQGFDFVATGHYARVTSDQGQVASANQRATSHYSLATSLDTAKDQTYFLWTLTQRQLAQTLFPVGQYTKPEVRALAESFGLPTAQKKDSQGVCFLGKIDMQAFLAHYIPPREGVVLDTEGKPIGTHNGAPYFTLGQRHGFTVHHSSPNTPPLFVISKDIEANTLTVAPQARVSHPGMSNQSILLSEVNWIDGVSPTRDESSATEPALFARLRYRQRLFPVNIACSPDGTVTVYPHTPEDYVPSGQSLVIYQGDRCLGGGVIV